MGLKDSFPRLDETQRDLLRAEVARRIIAELVPLFDAGLNFDSLTRQGEPRDVSS